MVLENPSDKEVRKARLRSLEDRLPPDAHGEVVLPDPAASLDRPNGNEQPKPPKTPEELRSEGLI